MTTNPGIEPVVSAPADIGEMVERLVQRAREYEAAVRLGGGFPPLAEKSLDAAKAALLTDRDDLVRVDRLPTNCELSWCEVDGDPSECAWQVHRVNGGRNDREWTRIGIGEKPSDAIVAALKVLDG